MHKENYEPETALVELGVGHERPRRKGATVTGELWARPVLSTREQQPERKRERQDEIRERGREREEQAYWASKAREVVRTNGLSEGSITV
jgi:hypothetical protein